MQSSLGWAKPV